MDDDCTCAAADGGQNMLTHTINALRAELAEVRSDLAKTREAHVAAREDLAHLKACKVAECDRCAVLLCPYDDPLHTHHDGCPACCFAEDMPK
jgi:tRNA(Ile)-lysidine synthase TilS/MesJ